MDLLSKQLTNKENQFREMSIQLMNHLKKINLLSAEIEEVKSGNEVIKKRIEEKDVEIANLLKEKLELLDVLYEIENPGKEGIVEDMDEQAQDIETKQNIEHQEESKISEDKKVEDVKETETNKVDVEAKEEVEEEKEETYISDNIDITSELEKLGLVDLVKKY